MIAFLPHQPTATPDDFGYIVWDSMLNEDDPRPAREQLDSGYQHGGGFTPFPGFTLMPDDTLAWPSDPLLYPIAELRLRHERVVLYPYSIIAVIQPDRSFESCRMD